MAWIAQDTEPRTWASPSIKPSLRGRPSTQNHRQVSHTTTSLSPRLKRHRRLWAEKTASRTESRPSPTGGCAQIMLAARTYKPKSTMLSTTSTIPKTAHFGLVDMECPQSAQPYWWLRISCATSSRVRGPVQFSSAQGPCHSRWYKGGLSFIPQRRQLHATHEREPHAQWRRTVLFISRHSLIRVQVAIEGMTKTWKDDHTQYTFIFSET